MGNPRRVLAKELKFRGNWVSGQRATPRSVFKLRSTLCALALNWYVFESKPAVQRVMVWVSLLSSVVVITLEIASGVKA